MQYCKRGGRRHQICFFFVELYSSRNNCQWHRMSQHFRHFRHLPQQLTSCLFWQGCRGEVGAIQLPPAQPTLPPGQACRPMFLPHAHMHNICNLTQPSASAVDVARSSPRRRPFFVRNHASRRHFIIGCMPAHRRYFSG